MEVSILSKELVKPSTLIMQPPLKLNLLDQLTPTSYSPAILFFQNDAAGGHFKINNISQISNRLKRSLSLTLTDYYPLAGRIRDNFTIHDFHEGAPFIETRVRCHMSDFLQDQGCSSDHLGLLNNLLPVRAERLAPDTGPQVAVQLNVFECGGLAIGLCSSHKSHDGTVVSSFVASWATNYRHVSDTSHVSKKIITPNFSEGVSAFPPVRSIPPHYTSLSEDVWFGSKGEPVNRRFVFDSESVSKLRLKAKSRTLENPTRAEALSAFIWKSTISASASHAKTNHQSSLMCQAVDLRRLIRPRLSRHSFGNLVLTADSKYDPSVDGEPRTDSLALLARNSMSEMNIEFLEQFMGEGGSGAMFDYLDHDAETTNEATSILNVACWHGFGLSKIDFGLGPAVWVALSGPGVSGKEDFGVKYISDTVILVENNKGGIEAWLTLDEPGVMKALENDQEFLEFASTNSPIL